MGETRRHPLTIGMATYDDFDGVYFTITSLMIHHRQAMQSCDIVVVDNRPDSSHGKELQKWVTGHVPNGQYFAFEGVSGTAQARNEVFRRASGDAVLCLDCHVMLDPGVVARLVEYHARHPQSCDLLTGPLLSDSGKLVATHQDPVWRNGAWGVWSIDDRGRDPGHEPFEVWQQGLGLFSCRRNAWVGFHQDFRGFGGCESYVMEKFRRRGGSVLCCPWLRWTHRFPRPNGVPYQVSRNDTLRNYLVGFEELGIDPQAALEHFEVLGQGRATVATARQKSTAPLRVIGNSRLGSVRMRGGPIANYHGCEISAAVDEDLRSKCEVIFAVKNVANPARVRKNCDRLVYDPLDVFSSDSNGAGAIDYWRQKYRQLRFDDILATSPACYSLMRDALPDHVRVHLVPHHSDPSIHGGWYAADGPIVYSGLQQYIRSGLTNIQRACDEVGRELITGRDSKVLNGGSLSLALRLAPYTSELYRSCKPQVKIANSIAAGIRCVATASPATTSMYPNVTTVANDFDPGDLADAMRIALNKRQPDGECFLANDYINAFDRILGSRRITIYTAIFGGRDVLQEPAERLPGVQYICFTDNPRFKSKVWNIRYYPPTSDPVLQAKRFKILSHEVLDCDLSLWLDGRIQLKSLNGVFDWIQTDLAFQRHPTRCCIYDEAEHCKRVRKGDPSMIDRSIARYAQAGHPRDYGLWCAGIIVRRHTRATAQFNQRWWDEITSGSSRDQISLPIVMRTSSATVSSMPRHLPRTIIRPHTIYTDAPSRQRG